MKGQTMIRQDNFLVCPACKNEIAAEFSAELGEVTWGDTGTGTAPLKLVGVRIQHDCIPKVIR